MGLRAVSGINLGALVANTLISTSTGDLNISPTGNLDLGSNGGAQWQVDTTSRLKPVADNASDIGVSAVNRVRNVYLAGVLVTQTNGAFSATSGAATMNVASSNFFSCTPTGSITLTTTGTPLVGVYYYIVYTTSGVSSFVITYSTGFKSTGTLTTGTVSGKVFTMSFISDGTNLNEVARTVAM